MAGNIKFSSEELIRAKDTINNDNDDLYNLLQNAKKAITGLENTYVGEASKVLMQKINDMENAFTRYKEKVNKITEWIDLTVKSDISTEETQKANAEKTPNASAFNFGNN